MKFAMVVNNLEVSGGYQKLVIRLAQQLDKLGHQTVTYTPALDVKNCYPKEINTIPVISLKPSEKTGTLVDRYTSLVAKIAKDIDVLIIHDELSLIAAALLPAPRIVWMLNNQLPESLGKYLPEFKSTLGQKHLTVTDRWRDTKEARRRIKLMRRGLKKVDRFAVYDSFNKQLVSKYLHKTADIV